MTRSLRPFLLALCVGSSLQADARPVLRKALLPASVTSFLAGIGYSIYCDHQGQATTNQLALSKILIALGFVGMAADLWLDQKPQPTEPDRPTTWYTCTPPYVWNNRCEDCDDCGQQVEEEEQGTDCDCSPEASDDQTYEKMIYYTQPMNQWEW